MKSVVHSVWQGNLAFESRVGKHLVRTDAPEEFGGDDSGASPKKLMLTALAGCTGVDIVAILRKMRVEFDALDIRVEADATGDTPSVYTAMHIIYTFKGDNLDQQKLEKAVKLSKEKYCGVSMMYENFLTISSEVVIDSSSPCGE